jgi:uncharacterized membrane protein required for colicin V production
MSLDQLPVNAFDFALVAILGVGIYRGRRHGMSQEMLLMFKWLAVLLGCAFLYEPVGTWLSEASPFSLLSSFLMVYVTFALLILGGFALVNRAMGGKLLGSDVFGRAEYYLGMGSGFVRYACILLVGLALLNARYYSQKEVQKNLAEQQDLYGSDFFPGLHTAQATVFEKSLTGPYIREYLGCLLIKPTAPQNKDIHQKEASLPY